MKSKVILEREPVDPLSRAWMKELRSHNKTKREYEVDPYAEVYQFRDDVYGILKDSADGMGAPWMYLVVGKEKALLIDTGFGIGNLKGLAEELAEGKPLYVVNTHAHFDHCYGNCQFEKVYCYEYEAPYLEQKQDPHIWDYLFDENGKNIWCDFDRKDIVPFQKYEIVPCPDGSIFSLGPEHEVELIFLGGHSAGHAAFLDKKNRILFCGDDFISMRVGIGMKRAGMPHTEFCTVNGFYKQAKKLSERLGEFDSLFPGHFIVDIDNSTVLEMIKVLERILENPENCDFEERNHGGILTRFCHVRGLGLFAYTAENVF